MLHRSPVHPALFACVDGTGTVCIWNIIQDIELPVMEMKVSSVALNVVRWSSDGCYLLIGDSRGKVYQYSINRSVSLLCCSHLSFIMIFFYSWRSFRLKRKKM